jgi:hypothetical protein
MIAQLDHSMGHLGRRAMGESFAGGEIGPA